MEEVGVLLPADGHVHRVHALPVLLDGGHGVAAGQRALPHLAAGERDAVLDARADAGARQGPAADHRLPAVALEHDVDRDRLDHHLPRLRHVRRLRARTPPVPRLGIPRHRDLHHLPGAADAALHSARRHHPQHAARQYAVGADAHVSDVPDPVLHVAPDGLLQDHPEGARGMRAHRRGDAFRRHGADHLPGGGARHPVGRHLRLHAVVERVHLRARVHVLGRAEDGTGGRGLGADPRRYLLLGPAHGRGAARIRAGRAGLLVLRRILRHWPHRAR